MRRVSVVGIPGAGKSTLTRRLATLLDVPSIELDALHFQPNWVVVAPEEFVERTAAVTSGEGWVVDGNYSSVQPTVVWPAADTVVWLDLSRPVVMTRLVRRTLARLITRRPLWNGNRERLANVLSWDPDRSILRWAWTRFRPYRDRYEAAWEDPAWAHLHFVRLRSPREVAAFLDRVRRDLGTAPLDGGPPATP